MSTGEWSEGPDVAEATMPLTYGRPVMQELSSGTLTPTSSQVASQGPWTPISSGAFQYGQGDPSVFVPTAHSLQQPQMPDHGEHNLRRRTPYGTITSDYRSSLSQSSGPRPRLQIPMTTISPPQQYPIDLAYDSMPFATASHPLQFVNPLAQQAATVIQHPSCPYGPTASGPGGAGPYGPYWHDGTFAPFRPAAFTAEAARLQQVAGLDDFLHTGRHQANPNPDTRSNVSYGMPSHTGSWHDGLAMPADGASRYFTDEYFDMHRGDVHTTAHGPYPDGTAHQTPQAPALPPYAAPADGRYEWEAVFQEGLRAYRDLLAHLSKVKRETSVPNQQPRYPDIYPRIPRQSRRPLTPQLWASQSEDAAHMATFMSDASENTSDMFGMPGHQHENLARPAMAYNRSFTQPGHHVQRIDQRSGLSISPDRSVPGPLTPSTRPQALHYVVNGDHTQLWRRCSRLLHMLERFDEFSSHTWVNGLNLSGCLAYGLGQYPKAMHKYQRVLELEPLHVEAMANLAATLLALGRRHEAEQYWRKVVHLSPDYFEAAEHLVGLLCADGKPAEAIKLVASMQERLRLSRLNVAPDVTSTQAFNIGPDGWLSSTSAHTTGFDTEPENVRTRPRRRDSGTTEPGFGSSGYAIAGVDNGRMLALVHAKANLMYTQGDHASAARAFEDVVMIATGCRYNSLASLVRSVLEVLGPGGWRETKPVLLRPEQALRVAQLCFPPYGRLPGLAWIPTSDQSLAIKSALLTTSNSLLSLAKMFQDGMSGASRARNVPQLVSGVREILALYYLSLSIHASPSTANNVGILVAGVQQQALPPADPTSPALTSRVPGVVPGSGIDIALAYYNYGLSLDAKHAHLYTNLGSLLKDAGQLDAAIEMYKRAVQCDGKFDIALANLANAVKDKGHIAEAIECYKRAVQANPDFAEAVCGLVNALNSVCKWTGRGGVLLDSGRLDRWHVGADGMLYDATVVGMIPSGWMKKVVDTVEKQLKEGENWGIGCLDQSTVGALTEATMYVDGEERLDYTQVEDILQSWRGRPGEGPRVLRLIERITRRLSWRWYHDVHTEKLTQDDLGTYARVELPAALSVPVAPTVLPFHTFTSPLSARQVRQISERNAFRISTATLKAPWLPVDVYEPPAPPAPALKVGYMSSDFNNHPLAHLMQSVFGFHDPSRVEAHCYATTPSDGSPHRLQIEHESPFFEDVTNLSTEELINKIVADGIHILVNLNGYTRGARSEVFAARPVPLQMSFMGFAGTMGADWCDYLLADTTSVPPTTLSPSRDRTDCSELLKDDHSLDSPDSKWVYAENIIYCRSGASFFCCDHRQSAPDANAPRLAWEDEAKACLKMRAELFPDMKPDTVIFANFNQLYKIEPTTFRSWLRILARIPNAILWLLRFPDLGEQNLLETARRWAGETVAKRIIFTDVAHKSLHISRSKIVDLFLDTPECNAHTTAADVLWSGTPLLTYPRYEYKMCSRMAASILRGALPNDTETRMKAEKDLIATSQEDYEAKAIRLGSGLKYVDGCGQGRLMELRRMLTEARWTSQLFDTRRWVSDLEDGYEEAWRRWVAGQGGDIHLDQLPARTRPIMT